MYYLNFRRLNFIIVLLLTGLAAEVCAQTGVFTVQLGTPPLVRHGEIWRYHLGTTAPVAGWQTVAESELGATWSSGPGGFGFEDGDDATDLSVMMNLTTTVYTRRSFEIDEAVAAERRLELVMDYDDGFVAWLDGVEVARSANAPGAVGQEPPRTAVTLAGQNHEALGYRGLPPEVYDLGPVGTRLQPGTHVLAVMGINAGLTSSDLSLIADLRLTGGEDVGGDDGFFSQVGSNVVVLTGSNTLAGSTRVTVNGVTADYDLGTGEWSRAQPLSAGMNRLYIAALDAEGSLLGSVSRDVVSAVTRTTVGGVLGADATWLAGGGVVNVTSALTVPAGVNLRIEPGVVVLVEAGASIQALTGGRVDVAGTEAERVFFLPADGRTAWGGLSASGVGSQLNLRQAEVVNGPVAALADSRVLVEDCVLRDYVPTDRLFVSATEAEEITLRRTHIARYNQCRFSGTPVLIEDCLIEQVSSDATDFADHPGVVVRRTTYRHGIGANTDAVDNGNTPGMVVEGCLIRGFPDKGVSVADLSHGTIVRNSLIYDCGFGISVYAASNCVFNQNTVADNSSGMALWVRSGHPGPGLGAGTNNIVWGNSTNIALAGGGELSLAFSDVEGTNWPGLANLSVDPMFEDAAARDYRLQEESLAKFAGDDDLDMGVLFPVGGLPSAPYALAARVQGTNAIELQWQDDADNEAGFLVERSEDGATWAALGAAGPNAAGFVDANAALQQLYFYRVRATNDVGKSRWSNPASGVRQPPVTLVGGTLGEDTTWTSAMGTILISSSVIVPDGVTLTVEAGAVVRSTNGSGLRVNAGGSAIIAGTRSAPVRIEGADVHGISAVGNNAMLTIRHADLAGTFVGATNGAVMLIEDTYLHDFFRGGWAIGASELATVTLRRCHFRSYYETLWRGSLAVVEDSLFELPEGDALDFDGVSPGSVIRRCTFRHGPRTNTDAIDLGPGLGRVSVGVLIADSLLYDFPHDGGVSAGEGVWGLTLTNTLIYGCRGGIKAKETPGQPDTPTTMGIYQCTFVDNVVAGISNFVKSSGAEYLAGQVTNSFNNIVQGNGIDLVLRDAGTMDADHSLFGSTNFVGGGTFTAGAGVLVGDPLFVNRGARDYRLQPGSPAIGAGRDGADLGCRFPVGAPMAASHPAIAGLQVADGAATVQFWADSEKAYTLQASDRPIGGTWNTLTNVPTRLRPEWFEVADSVGAGPRYYRLSTP